jgi:phosphoenolpyruvate carboxylase
MTDLREASSLLGFQMLKDRYHELEKLSSSDLYEIGHAFTLMLELMNVCENAFRSHRLASHHPTPTDQQLAGEQPNAIVYVLTAHPTEARSPQNIAAFHEIQDALIRVLQAHQDAPELEFSNEEKNEILHGIEVAWQASIVRSRAPTVKDEAEHIYSMLFRDDVLFSLFGRAQNSVPLYIRSWVGGDKDGHPGVNERNPEPKPVTVAKDAAASFAKRAFRNSPYGRAFSQFRIGPKADQMGKKLSAVCAH